MKEFLWGFCGFWALTILTSSSIAAITTVWMREFPGSPYAHPGVLVGIMGGFGSLVVVAAVFLFVVVRS